MKRLFRNIAAFMIGVFGTVAIAFAEYTPLITSTDFNGVKADVGTAAAGMITIMIVIVGFVVLWGMFRR